LRAGGYYTRHKIPEPPLKDFLDIVALGTVCDMVPLTGANRLFVRAGLQKMAATGNPGLKALMETSGMQGEPGTYHCGFVLGPRINAGSRVHRSDLGARLLATDDPEEARSIAFTLEDCNTKRKDIQAVMMRQAESQVRAQVQASGADQKPVILAADESWHAGLAGLVAGRLKESYGKPAAVIAFTQMPDGTLEGRGSGRSVPGVNIAQAFIDGREAGLLLKGGGHAMAGGFTILPDKIEAFRSFLEDHVRAQMEGKVIAEEVQIDGLLTVRGIRPDLVRTLESCAGPFGTAFPEPLFILSQVRIHQAALVGGNHVRALVSDWEGGTRIKCMAFRAADTPLGQALLKQAGRQMDLAGYLKLNIWQGRESAEFHIKDGRFSGEGDALCAAS
jgi:single-stranded-DNA-specific exonuclease